MNLNILLLLLLLFSNIATADENQSKQLATDINTIQNGILINQEQQLNIIFNSLAKSLQKNMKPQKPIDEDKEKNDQLKAIGVKE